MVECSAKRVVSSGKGIKLLRTTGCCKYQASNRRMAVLTSGEDGLNGRWIILRDSPDAFYDFSFTPVPFGFRSLSQVCKNRYEARSVFVLFGWLGCAIKIGKPSHSPPVLAAPVGASLPNRISGCFRLTVFRNERTGIKRRTC